MDAEPTATPERLALFPLNLVLFPGGLLPLRIFEPRYLRMVSECLKADRPFVVAAIVDGPEAGGVAMTARSGTLARIIDWEQGEDGLLHLVCEGGQRCRIADVEVESDQLLRATVDRLGPLPEHPLPDELRWMAELLDELLEKLGEPFERLHRPDPGAGHVAARLTELLPLPLAEKVALFEIDSALERIRRLAGLLQPDEEDAD
jgi:Lon protease-like protein